MKVRKYLYPPNHSWIVVVDAAREDSVPDGRRGKLLGEVDLDSGDAGADPAELRRCLEEEGYCLVQPAVGRLHRVRG